jgi:hypothetical protein
MLSFMKKRSLLFRGLGMARFSVGLGGGERPNPEGDGERERAGIIVVVLERK